MCRIKFGLFKKKNKDIFLEFDLEHICKIEEEKTIKKKWLLKKSVFDPKCPKFYISASLCPGKKPQRSF